MQRLPRSPPDPHTRLYPPQIASTNVVCTNINYTSTVIIVFHWPNSSGQHITDSYVSYLFCLEPTFLKSIPSLHCNNSRHWNYNIQSRGH
jgi:hypothetical protein